MSSVLRRPLDPTQYTPHFTYRGRKLFCETVSLEDVAAWIGTPSYVYSRAAISEAYRQLDQALRSCPHLLCYSVKANSNLGILRLFAELGSGFDIVSGGELYRLGKIGVQGPRIVFSGVGKTREEIREALNYRGRTLLHRSPPGILLFNVESAAELELLVEESARLVARGGGRAPAAMRVNPDVRAGGHPHISTGHHRHKFGVDWSEARRLYLTHRDSRWIGWQGVSAHIGSQILSPTPFRRAVGRLAGYVRELKRSGIELRYLDCGGGLGVRYARERPLSVSAYAQTIVSSVRALGCRLLLEPGRVLVGRAGILLTRVLYTKQNHGKTFVVVDAAMNDFLRPALYGAIHPMTHVVRPGTKKPSPTILADLVGPVCETGDCFLEDWPIEKPYPGDLLAIWGTGAYGFVQASNYNSRLRPAEVLVEGSRCRLIRRREVRAELMRGE